MKGGLLLESNTLKDDEDVMSRIAAVNEGVFGGETISYVCYGT